MIRIITAALLLAGCSPVGPVSWYLTPSTAQIAARVAAQQQESK